MRLVPLMLAVTLVLVPFAGGQPPEGAPAPEPVDPPMEDARAAFWTWQNTLSWPEESGYAVEVQGTPAIDMDSEHLVLGLPPVRGDEGLTATVFLYDAPFQDPPLGVLPPYTVFDSAEGGAMGVAAWGDCVMIGLSGGSAGSGRATIFHHTGDAQDPFKVVAEFKAPPGAKDFGRAVAFDDMGAVIGAEGAVYLYGPESEGYPLVDTITGGPGLGHDVDMSYQGIILGDPVANEIRILDRQGNIVHVQKGDHILRLGTDVKIQDTGFGAATAAATAIQVFEDEHRHTVQVLTFEDGMWSDQGMLHSDAIEGPPSVGLDRDVVAQPASSQATLITSPAPMPDGDEAPPHVHKDAVRDQVQVSPRFGHDAAAMDGWLAVSDGALAVHIFARSDAAQRAPTMPPTLEECAYPVELPYNVSVPDPARVPGGADPQVADCFGDAYWPEDVEIDEPRLPPPPVRDPAARLPRDAEPPVPRPAAIVDPEPVEVVVQVEPRKPTRINPTPDVEVTYEVDEPVTIVETVDVSPEPLPELPPVPGEQEIPGTTTYLDIKVHDVHREADVDVEKPVEQTVTIKITYDEAALPTGVSEEELALHFYDGEDWVDLRKVGAGARVPASTPEGDLRVYDAGVDTEANTVWARVDHTSTYALGLSGATTVPAPASEVPWPLIAVLAVIAGMVWAANGMIAARQRKAAEHQATFVVEAPAVTVPVERDS